MAVGAYYRTCVDNFPVVMEGGNDMKLWITLAVVGVFGAASLIPGCQSAKTDKNVESKPTSMISPIRMQASRECFAAAIPFELESMIEPLDQFDAPASPGASDLLALNSSWQPMSAETSLYNVEAAEVMISSDLLREPEKAAKPVVSEFPTVRTDTLLPNVSLVPGTPSLDGPELDQASFLLRQPDDLVSGFEAEVMVTSMLHQEKTYANGAMYDNDLATLQIPEIGYLAEPVHPQF